MASHDDPRPLGPRRKIFYTLWVLYSAGTGVPWEPATETARQSLATVQARVKPTKKRAPSKAEKRKKTPILPQARDTRETTTSAQPLMALSSSKSRTYFRFTATCMDTCRSPSCAHTTYCFSQLPSKWWGFLNERPRVRIARRIARPLFGGRKLMALVLLSFRDPEPKRVKSMPKTVRARQVSGWGVVCSIKYPLVRCHRSKAKHGLCQSTNQPTKQPTNQLKSNQIKSKPSNE